MDFYSRDLIDTDIDDINELHNLTEVTKYQTWKTQSNEETKQFLREVINQDSNVVYNVLVNPDTDKVIGTIQLVIDEVNKSAEIEFIIHPNYWNNGIATNIAKTIIKYAFKVLKLNRVAASIDSNNTAARMVLQNLEMKLEGVLRENRLVDGEYRDTLSYAILRSEY
ncbi:N-acetyltransferase [Staphylococcus xylosus]|jgi:ribosomal-protein-alanine N-acetyltransferase|uniref:GNAT family N-acetyltransferase n=1 Tax=Staphylococcus TaxID=1279 RepID=UPI00040710D7|nr:GNAT family protein [Staphylococcus xylosus]AID02941.1 GNAT family acetyltransferase [Staphylococcus xylosus]ARD76043.1 GNAT family acetyltransferase [Staphylococcus xylosus]KTW23031.1 GNAT family acetyltransferase [Staphylococcus xylosus]MBF0811891.1 GNAT family N-acetyltransferase [Staphylococcus xylosus]MBO3075746.1 GNAT family N-acetyltransferase [Staphylococcus xylosus]